MLRSQPDDWLAAPPGHTALGWDWDKRNSDYLAPGQVPLVDLCHPLDRKREGGTGDQIFIKEHIPGLHCWLPLPARHAGNSSAGG